MKGWARTFPLEGRLSYSASRRRTVLTRRGLWRGTRGQGCEKKVFGGRRGEIKKGGTRVGEGVKEGGRPQHMGGRRRRGGQREHYAEATLRCCDARHLV